MQISLSPCDFADLFPLEEIRFCLSLRLKYCCLERPGQMIGLLYLVTRSAVSVSIFLQENTVECHRAKMAGAKPGCSYSLNVGSANISIGRKRRGKNGWWIIHGEQRVEKDIGKCFAYYPTYPLFHLRSLPSTFLNISSLSLKRNIWVHIPQKVTWDSVPCRYQVTTNVPLCTGEKGTRMFKKKSAYH